MRWLWTLPGTNWSQQVGTAGAVAGWGCVSDTQVRPPFASHCRSRWGRDHPVPHHLYLTSRIWLWGHVVMSHGLVCWCCIVAGVDRQVKVWDVRTFKPLHAYFANSPATALDISQRGLLAVGQGRRLQVGSWCELSTVGAAAARSPNTSMHLSMRVAHSMPMHPVAAGVMAA